MFDPYPLLRAEDRAFFEVTMARAMTRRAKQMKDLNGALALKTLSFEKRQMEEKCGIEAPEAFRQKKVIDPLTKNLGCTHFYQSMRFSWMVHEIFGLKYPMEVSRYYPEIKTAIDIGQVLIDEVDMKKKLCAENGVKYLNIESSNDMRSLALGMS